MTLRTLILASVLSLAAVPALAQAPAPAAGPAPASKPANPRDLSGVWMNDNTLDERMKREGRHKQTDAERSSNPAPPTVRPLTPEYEAIFQKEQALKAHVAEGAESCMWPGMPGILTYPYPFEILHTPGRITFIYEAESQVRRIFLDRKEHLPSEDLDPSFNGDSIGHWEGDELVIDTIGFNTLTTVRGLPHSGDLRIAERIHWLDDHTIQDDVTLTDAKAFTKPVQQKVVYSRRADWRIREYSCAENNRDTPTASGERKGGTVVAKTKKK